MPVIIAAAILAFVGFLASRWAFGAFQNHLDRPRLPSQSIVALPPTGSALSDHGRQQLHIAIVFMTRLVDNLELIPQEKTREMVIDWFEVSQTTKSDEVRLLNSARQILHRLEIEEDIYKEIDASNPELRKTLRIWNQNNSEGKEHD